MAQKATKTLAVRNTALLNRLLLLTTALHSTFHILRLLPLTYFRRSLLRYILFTLPALAIQFWFERIGRPTRSANGEVKSAGEDLDAKGLTEWMWDVLYWTDICLGVVVLAGDWAWWLWAAIPLYSAYLAYTTFSGARQGLAGMTGAGQDGVQGQQAASSKRQAKLEKRGGQRVAYR
ncbi:hypothetical protein B0A49_02073 [Cryomyces minteri]|uniref:DUF788 domain protein n=2 Tax=Cryomyces TaxID=329878 RepID=A0A4U0XNA8_9PEZI|nr:hypothetical protein B0A49_02073 [Cryomyces minteri]